MNARLFVPALVVLIVASYEVSSAEEQTVASTLPAEIVHYYSVCNAVNLYSTPDERHVLGCNQLPPATRELYNSDRLRQIYTLMRWILDQEHECDPEIMRWWSRSFIKDTPTGVAVVERRDIAKNSINVIVTVYQDDREIIRGLVSDLESTPGEKAVPLVPPEQEKVLPLVRSNISRREIHTWFKLGDTWIKREVNLVLLDG